MEFSDVLAIRRSIRAFMPDAVSDEDLDRILMAIRFAPTAGNLQAYQVIVVRDAGIRKKLAQAAWGQDFVAQAPVVLGFLADRKRVGAHYGQRGRELYALQDATIACTYAMLAATEIGLGTVWVGAFDTRKVASILNAKDDELPVALLALGYPNEFPEPRPRRDLTELVRRL